MNILGTGGHANVVIDTARKAGISISAIYDDDKSLHGIELAGIMVKDSIKSDINGDAIIAIGRNFVRKEIAQRVSTASWQTVVHPSAVIADDVVIGEGTVVMAGAVIQTGTQIGKHVIINTGACIDHDCSIGDYTHVAPNCSVAGGVKLGKGVFLGIGSSVVQYLEIEEWSIVGAGAVVTDNIPSNCTAVGVPAKPIKFHED